ncbi:MAG: hypothetical protein AB1627_00415 [Chloroflexota bacterium]
MHRRSTPKSYLLALALPIALIVAACSSGGSGATGGGDTAAGGDAGGATISIATPADGAEVSIPFDVQLDASVPLGEPETGNHHAHLYFDTGTDSGDYDIVYGNAWQVTRELAPGEHTITVALANPDHSLAGPTGQLTITVGGAGSGDSGAPPSAAPPLGY